MFYNKNIIIRFFDSNELNLIPTSNYLYNPYSHIVQLLPFTIDDVYNKFNTDRDLSFIYTPGFT